MTKEETNELMNAALEIRNFIDSKIDDLFNKEASPVHGDAIRPYYYMLTELRRTADFRVLEAIGVKGHSIKERFADWLDIGAGIVGNWLNEEKHDD